MLFLKLFGAESCRKATHGRVGISFLVIRENRCGAVETEEQRDICSIPRSYSKHIRLPSSLFGHHTLHSDVFAEQVVGEYDSPR
jgi:hypothetical protein